MPTLRSPARALRLPLLVAVTALLASGCFTTIGGSHGPPGVTSECQPGEAACAEQRRATIGTRESFCVGDLVWFNRAGVSPDGPYGAAAVFDWGDGTSPETVTVYELQQHPTIEGYELWRGRVCASHAFDRPGTYRGSVQVLPGFARQEVHFEAVLTGPTVTFVECLEDGSWEVWVETGGLWGASYSQDPAISWMWRWGDGSAPEVNVHRRLGRHRYTTPGPHRVVITTAKNGQWFLANGMDVTLPTSPTDPTRCDPGA